MKLKPVGRNKGLLLGANFLFHGKIKRANDQIWSSIVLPPSGMSLGLLHTAYCVAHWR